MQAVLTTFLTRERSHESLGCGPLRFQPEHDLLVAGTDPKVYHHAHALLRSYAGTHAYAVILLDMDWGHHFAHSEIVEHITSNLVRSGWSRGRIEVVVIQPELEAWIWQDHPHVEQVFFRNLREAERDRLRESLGAAAPGATLLRGWLQAQKLWPAGHPKPSDPKAAVQRAAAEFRSGNALAIYQQICRRISVRGCQELGFLTLRSALQRWFPPAQVDR